MKHCPELIMVNLNGFRIFKTIFVCLLGYYNPYGYGYGYGGEGRRRGRGRRGLGYGYFGGPLGYGYGFPYYG